MTTTYTPEIGTPGWFELVTTDQDGARKFYGSLFDWTPVDTPLPDGSSYTVFKLDGRDVAACYTMMADQRELGIPVHWGVYFRVEDCDAAVARVLAVADFGRAARRIAAEIAAMPPVETAVAAMVAMASEPTS